MLTNNEYEQVCRWLDQLRAGMRDIFASRRWSMANYIGQLYYTLTNRGRQPDPTFLFNSIFSEIYQWTENKATGITPAGPTPYPYTHLAALDRYLAESLLYKEIPLPPSPRQAGILQDMETYKQKLVFRFAKKEPAVKVSIIMPTYNRGRIIGNSIESIVNQTYPNWELIVVDNGSKDNTEQIVAKFSDTRIIYKKLAQNGGVCQGRNFGLALSSGAYITYLDSDNTWDQNYLLIMTHSLLENPATACAYCGQEIFRFAQGQYTPTAVRFGLFNRALLENRNDIDLNIFIHSRALWETCGGFDESLDRLVDWDLILRYSTEYCPLPIPAILGQYYVNRANRQISCNSHRNLVKNNKRIRAKISSNPVLIPQLETHCYYSNRGRTGPGGPGKKTVIVIPNGNDKKMLAECLGSIETYTPARCYEIVILTNQMDTRALNRYLDESGEHRNFIDTQKHGFYQTVAETLCRLHPNFDDMVILNALSLVTENWLSYLLSVQLPETGVVVPRVVLADERDTQPHVPFCNPNHEMDISLSFSEKNILNPFIDLAKGYVELTHASFHCMRISRECYNLAGLPRELDHNEALYGNMVRAKGYRIIYTPYAKVYKRIPGQT